MFPINFILLWSYQQSAVNVPHVVSALKNFTLDCNLISVFVELVVFAMVILYLLKFSTMVIVDNFSKYEKIAAKFELFAKKNATFF